MKGLSLDNVLGALGRSSSDDSLFSDYVSFCVNFVFGSDAFTFVIFFSLAVLSCCSAEDYFSFFFFKTKDWMTVPAFDCHFGFSVI